MNSTTNASLKHAYQEYYRGPNTSDSPDKSRLLMAQAIAARLLLPEMAEAQATTVLNLGAGKQAVEKLLRMLANSSGSKGKYAGLQEKLRTTNVITLDIAAGPSNHQPGWLNHVIASSAELPLRSGAVDLVVSNHSIDMLRCEPDAFKSALSETARVLKPSGSVLFYYHHAQLFSRQCAYYEQHHSTSPQAEYFDPAVPNPFYSDSRAIIDDLSSIGLQTNKFSIQTDGIDNWWSVEAQRA